MKRLIGRLCAIISLCVILWSCSNISRTDYAEMVKKNALMHQVDSMAKAVIAAGFNAGDVYGEVWIRDFNTFIELSMDVLPDEEVRRNLNIFWGFQGVDGEIVDGFVPKTGKLYKYDYIRSAHEPDYLAHKNTVETDQETSLIQAVYKYVRKSGNTEYLNSIVYGRKVIDRMEDALTFLAEKKTDKTYGLLLGATTIDWGDVQPEHEWGVAIDENTHYAIDIYDNAMYVIALENFLELCNDSQKAEHWKGVCDSIRKNVRKHLWDDVNQKFIPHIYLAGSPFPSDFDENKIYYHGGTAVAVQAGLLSREEVLSAKERMLENMQKAHAKTIGLTLYPTYPPGYFKNTMLYPYGYQNGGDWTWFGARMIMGLIENGFIAEAYELLQPMLSRAVENKGFYEWYTPAGEPMGSGTYRGEAGVLYKCITMLRDWAEGRAEYPSSSCL